MIGLRGRRFRDRRLVREKPGKPLRLEHPRAAAAGEAIHVPLLRRQEFVNAMVVLERRRRLKAADAAKACAELADMNLATDRELVDFDALAGLARRFKLSAYEATYLDLLPSCPTRTGA